MRRPAGLLLAGLVAVVLACAASAPAASGPARVTIVGDSVAASIRDVPAARRVLGDGFRVDLDLAVCRRLVATSCTHQGSTPSTALAAVRARGPRLGDVLVVDVGYNDESSGYRDGMREVIRVALAQGASAIIWVTLRERGGAYSSTNLSIRQEAKRWRQVHVADWNAFSRGKPWFVADGLHLSSDGADALARFLRSYVVRAAQTS